MKFTNIAIYIFYQVKLLDIYMDNKKYNQPSLGGVGWGEGDGEV